MKRQLIVPSLDVEADLTVYGQILGYNIEKENRSFLNKVRFRLQKEASEILLEEYLKEPGAFSTAYVEISTSTTKEYRSLLKAVMKFTEMRITNYNYQSEDHPISIVKGERSTVIPLQIIDLERMEYKLSI